ncbi:transposase [Candidatus Methanomethylophilus sp. 1R26]|uniref:IS1634 family transposase n=1 Tax=Candidatus Methanomethylophilus sp. 1R26 TaxID=1769296 RepID=UPI00138F2699|nr:transposase [Candidatus Methanomethylophilus sp. 1R26]
MEHYLGSTGVLDFVDTFKQRGVPMSRILTAMCTHILMGSNSMSRCSDWLRNKDVRTELRLDSGLSQRTINRAISIIGEHSDEIIVKLWEGLDARYHFENTDVNIDGSAVVVNGPEAELGAIGYPRDFRDQSRKQVEFLTAELQKSKMPFFMRAYKGNTSDPEQYRDALPDIFSMIREGSWIIVDNGGASGDILDSIVKAGHRYLTRVKMNVSDDKRISDSDCEWEYVEDGVCCKRHTFDSSGRTTYLFFSMDNWYRTYHSASRSFDRMVEAVKTYEDGHFRKSDFVTIRRNVLADVEVKVSLQTKFAFDESEREGIIREIMGTRAGIFKLESSEQLTPLEALDKYRARATVEHLIHSLKRVTGLKPLRVWSESSIRGSMMLALLSETAIAMARYEAEGKTKTVEERGRRRTVTEKPNTESIVWSLGHLTLTRIIDKGRRKQAVYSNWNQISREIFSHIRADIEGNLAFPT